MPKTKPTPGRGVGSGLGPIDSPNSTSNRRRFQALFVAARKPDRTVGGQPYWRVGVRVLTVPGGLSTKLDVYVSLCATCGEPFFFEEAAGRHGKWPNRRCAWHQRPGAAVRAFNLAWAVEQEQRP